MAMAQITFAWLNLTFDEKEEVEEVEAVGDH